MNTKIDLVNEALTLLNKPTAKRVRIAADILYKVAMMDRKNYCEPPLLTVVRYQSQKTSGVTLKKFICAICPSCGSKTFDLNTEIMQGTCLSCSFKSNNYKSDILNRDQKVKECDATKAK